jgi:hypothetical protein
MTALRAGASLVLRGYVAIDVERIACQEIARLAPLGLHLSKSEAIFIEQEMRAFWEGRVAPSLRAIPPHIVDAGGFGKLAKLAIGSIVGIAASSETKVTAEAVVRATRLAFCWAMTYPLVDDILDSPDSPATCRNELISLFEDVRRGEPDRFYCRHASTAALQGCLTDLLTLVPTKSRSRVCEAIWNVFEAHRIDAIAASAPPARTRPNANEPLLEVAMMKSVLVRVATMEVCGIPANWDDYRAMAAIGLFNQMGDDIWDAEDDLAEGRSTSVTGSRRD